MSGRLQHTIPRFLLKGFASKIHEHDVFVWMYRKDKPGREINTLNVGAENHFYGKTTEPSVDDQITEIEPLYSDLLSELRVTPENCPLEDQRIPTLITHLSMRTRFLRQSMTDSMSFLVDGLRDHLQDDNRLRAALLSDSRFRIF